jgi:hypothetical protein
MKLIDLIAFFRQGGTLEAFCKAQKLEEVAEVLEIYAQEPVSLEAELGFFPIEKTDGQIEFESEGVHYHNLFDFFYFLDVIEQVKGSEEPTNSELARKIFAYAMNDA